MMLISVKFIAILRSMFHLSFCFKAQFFIYYYYYFFIYLFLPYNLTDSIISKYKNTLKIPKIYYKCSMGRNLQKTI